MIIVPLLLACTDTDSAVVADTADTAGSTDTADTAVAGLNGTAPASDVPPPDFTATNMDGAARTQADLLGHPTVMWFYPAAATAG